MVAPARPRPLLPDMTAEARFWDELATRLAQAIPGTQGQDLERPMDLRTFVRHAWPIVEPRTPYVPGWHLDAIMDHLSAVTDGTIRQLLVNIPPRHAKSLMVAVFWQTWVWTFRPWSRWLFASYAATLSVRDSLKSRRILLSPWYQSQFSERVTLTGDQNLKSRFENTATGYRIATSVGGVGTGEGGDVVVVDDPHKVDAAESDVQRERAVTWWNTEMSTRLNDPETGAHVVVMQRVHESDLAGSVLEQGYTHLCLPAEYDPKRQCVIPSTGFRDPRTQEGELLWPARFSRVELERLKTVLGSYNAAAQLQQVPSPPGGGIFRRDWWRYWEVLPDPVDEWLQSWDMTFKFTTDGSYVVGQVWARVGAAFYLVRQVRDHMDFPATCRALREMTALFPQARLKLVEDKANGPAVIASLRQQVQGLVAVPVVGSKDARAHAVAPLVEAGNVYIPTPEQAPWVGDFVEELASFPRAAHDDQVDATSQALLRLSTMRQAPPKQRPSHWG